jgi:FkbM family methyltransferase
VRIARILSHAHLHLGRGRRVLGWMPQGDGSPRTVRLRNGQTLLVRPQDAIPLYEQVGEDVYDVPLGAREVGTIVDLGATVGFATLAMAARHKRASFVCVEPNDATRALLVENLRRNGVAAQTFGVGIAGAPTRFELDPAHYCAGDRLRSSDDGAIEGITLPELLDRAGVGVVDLLKVDIEGAERGVFAHAAQWAPRVRSLVAELHDGLTPAAADDLLSPHGFRRVPLPQRVRLSDLAAWTRSDS